MNNKEIPFNNKYIQNNLSSLLKTYIKKGFNEDRRKVAINFCSDDYSNYNFAFDTEMITSRVNRLIKDNQLRTRVSKSKDIQKKRTTEKAEVFTPKWVCEYQVNMCILGDTKSTKEELSEKIDEYIFDKEWTEKEYYSYINKTWLEACCGEAPYIVSRYDTVSGEDIDVKNRIGFLDRKLQLVSRKRDTFEEWFNDVVKAYRSVYAYEWQGDNLFIARCNLFMTFIDYYEEKFGRDMNNLAMDEYAKIIIDIIVKNTTQMNGLTWMRPGTDDEKGCLFDWEESDKHESAFTTYYKLFNAANGTSSLFD